MDGTLIDSEKYYRIFWPKALAAFGYTMTDEQALNMRSLGRPFGLIYLKELFGEEIDYYAIRSKRKELMEAYLKNVELELKPGAVEILEFLKKKGIQTAVATATELERAEKHLKSLGLYEYFDKIVSAHMVKAGKPSPDIYIYTCKVLERKPEECIAVEDSPNGVISAYKAGCKVIMVPDQTQPEPEMEPMLYACLDNLWKISELV